MVASKERSRQRYRRFVGLLSRGALGTAEFAELLQGGTLLMSRAPMDAALDSLPLPNALLTLRSWVTDLDFNGPLLVPSALIEIQ